METLDNPNTKKKKSKAEIILQVIRIYLKDLMNLFTGSGGGKGRSGEIS